MWRRFKKIFKVILGAWIFFTLTAFLSGAFISFSKPLQWFELPWSDVKDFVGTSDGKLFISLGFYRAVLIYDENGNFIKAQPYPYGKAGLLAVDEADNVYFRSGGEVFVYDKNWNYIKVENKTSVNFEENRTVFNIQNGSVIQRGWFTITKYSADGNILTVYRTPWYLIWAVFPFPAILAWVAMFTLAGWERLKNRP